MKEYTVTGSGWVDGSGWSYTEDLDAVVSDDPEKTAIEIAEAYADGLVGCDNYKVALSLDGEEVASAWCK